MVTKDITEIGGGGGRRRVVVHQIGGAEEGIGNDEKGKRRSLS